MERWWPTPIFLVLLSISTAFSQSKSRIFVGPRPADLIEIHNPGNQEITTGLHLNGVKLFSSTEDILSFILAMDDEFPGESVPRKVWRFCKDYRYHNVPLAEHCWYSSSPLLMFNSAGFGFCGDVSAVFKVLLDALGYQTRYWELGGIHVVAEVLNDGKWEMYDADCEVYYLNDDNLVASVDEIAADTSLITASERKATIDRSARTQIPEYLSEYSQTYAYSDYIKYAYVSPKISSDDPDIPYPCRFINYTEPQDGYETTFNLPPGSILRIGGIQAEPLLTSSFNRDANWPISYYSNISLHITRKWKGSLSFLPLLIHDVRGQGSFTITRNDGLAIKKERFEIGSPELKFALSVFFSPYSGIEIETEEGAEIIYLLNPLLIRVDDQNELILTGDNLEGLIVKQLSELPDNFDGLNCSIYPNPFTDLVNVHFFELDTTFSEKQASIQIVSSAGRVLTSNTYLFSRENPSLTIDTSSLAGGLYYLRIRLGSNEMTQRIFKY